MSLASYAIGPRADTVVMSGLPERSSLGATVAVQFPSLLVIPRDAGEYYLPLSSRCCMLIPLATLGYPFRLTHRRVDQARPGYPLGTFMSSYSAASC